MQKIRYVILVIVFVDLVVCGTILHELTHKFDFRNVEKTNEEFCFLGCGKVAGYYSFEITKEVKETENYQEILKHTEFHAYFVEFIWLFVCLFILIKLDNLLEKKCKI